MAPSFVYQPIDKFLKIVFIGGFEAGEFPDGREVSFPHAVFPAVFVKKFDV
jgi:hypothetical protein